MALSSQQWHIRTALIAAASLTSEEMDALEAVHADNRDVPPVPVRAVWEPFTPRSSHPARNAACPCGSGKKFKKCCRVKEPTE